MRERKRKRNSQRKRRVLGKESELFNTVLRTSVRNCSISKCFIFVWILFSFFFQRIHIFVYKIRRKWEREKEISIKKIKT